MLWIYKVYLMQMRFLFATHNVVDDNRNDAFNGSACKTQYTKLILKADEQTFPLLFHPTTFFAKKLLTRYVSHV